ncbi:MAG TPA: helix-hairpin-helix domain-containing protein, partial [Chitinophagaceae bacterium]
MKLVTITGLLMLYSARLVCQEPSQPAQQALENLASALQTDPEYDEELQDFEELKKHPLNLNVADGTALRRLGAVNDIQIENLLAYRRLLGPLINIYELQAVPGWDISTIRKIRMLITIESTEPVAQLLRERFKTG